MSVIGRAKVLVVEDDAAFSRTLVRALVGAGHTVESASDGAQAIARLDETAFDLVLSDLAMPLVGGLDLLRAVRARDTELPVILMTGAPAIESATQAVELGALRYLTKPLEVSALRKLVGTAVAEYRESRALRKRNHKEDLSALSESFDRALATLYMAYQPIVRPAARQVYAYEALVRPTERGLDNPGRLFAAAERLMRTQELGRVIRDRVASQLAASPCELVFVNLHPLDLLDDALYSPDAPLSRFARRVVLEITERAALEDLGDVPGCVAALRRLGYRIAVDDLGSGYSSLSSVAQLEPEVVKLDLSLVRGIDGCPIKQRLIQAMVEMFARLGNAVVAEGVETADEARTLRELGCELFQGFLFARPHAELKTPNW